MISIATDKKNIREELLKLLSHQKKSLSINKIAEMLKVSRVTVSKYLSILSEQGLVVSHRVGQFHFWTLKENDTFIGSNSLNTGILQMYFALLKRLEDYLTPENVKELGKKISDDLEITFLIGNSSITGEMNFFDKKNLEIVADAMTRIEALKIFAGFESFDPPVVNIDPPWILIRGRNSRFIKSPLQFQILAGIIESKANELFSEVRFICNIEKIFFKENIVDMKLILEKVA